MKKTLITFSLFFAINAIFAQVGGLSASKLGTFCTEAIPAQALEFEPFFEFATSTSAFDMNGTAQNLFVTSDESQIFSSTGFRFSYGLFKDFEIGVSIPVDISTINLGAKYKLPIEGKATFGLLAGYNQILGNAVYIRKDAMHESTNELVGGIILTYEFSDKFSLDFNAQYHKHLNTTNLGHDQGMCIGTDIGYYLIKNINFIIGSRCVFIHYKEKIMNAHLFTLNPGIAIEKAENFILVMNAPFDVFGKNQYKTFGFGLALTIILD